MFEERKDFRGDDMLLLKHFKAIWCAESGYLHLFQYWKQSMKKFSAWERQTERIYILRKLKYINVICNGKLGLPDQSEKL